MRIWLTRHGQTNLNKAHRMQGQVEVPLNETGIAQAKQMRAILTSRHPDLHFDAVYASPLRRAIKTASILGDVPETEIRIDERLIETDFGRYENAHYYLMGPRMTLYWALPEVFPAPPTVESTESMIRRSHAFLKELEQQPFDNVLVACHGGILRVLSGYLSDSPHGYQWRPKPHNCEVRVWESEGGQHRFFSKYSLK